MQMHRATLLALTVATLGLAGCNSQPVQPAASIPPGMAQTDTLAPTLIAHHWTLESATDAKGQPIQALLAPRGKPVVLGFSDTRLSIQGGCNLRGGSFQINAAQELVVGPMPTTMMACEPVLMQVDKLLATALAQPMKIRVNPGTPAKLTLVSASNDTMVFTGSPTMESLYGPATLMFLEVAPHTVACTHGAMPHARCLQVRERHFDAQGLPAGTPSEWQAFYDSIDGFTHTEGTRTVLRVKRFTRPNPPADASVYVYVLDLTVESELVTR